MRTLFLAALLALSAAVRAQQAPPPEMPAGMTAQTPPEQPALSGAPQAAPAPAKKAGPGEGTTIVGERESPIGLFITPWRNAYAEKDIDRPARLLQEQMLPIDEDVFLRQIEYYEALTGALRQKNAVTPPMPEPIKP